jgi:DNA invertase Pin-like site-specific DNA recombinase|tara:strand:+ start:53 stop:754 length:702 start_codon:yes stop_codon:yes gene_type:complete
MSLPLAVFYMRTSSATNLGSGDSEVRQKTAIQNYAEGKYQLIQGAYDEAVKGSDSIHDREGFRALLEFMSDNPECKTIIVSDISRFSRDLITQELGYRDICALGYKLIPADSPDHFLEDNPSSKLIRTILGSIMEWEKNSIVSKLLASRLRARKKSGKFTEKGQGKCEGRKNVKELLGIRKYNILFKKASKLHGQGLSYAKVSESLAKQGWVRPTTGMPFSPNQILKIIKLGV